VRVNNVFVTEHRRHRSVALTISEGKRERGMRVGEIEKDESAMARLSSTFTDAFIFLFRFPDSLICTRPVISNVKYQIYETR